MDTRSDREKAVDYAFRASGYDYDSNPPLDVDKLLLTAEKILLFIEGVE